MALAPAVLQAVEEIGYESPSPIQAQSIPPLLEGRDLLGMAQTGTGKTAAFALPLLSRLDLKRAEPQVLVLTPTRELALQVAEAMQTYARHLKGFHVLPVYGGQGMDTQLRQLRRGAHVIVGTPGRVQDHLRRRTLSLAGLSALVLDEADEMLRMGFIDDVEAILSHTPPTRQVALFSATMPEAIRRVARTHLRDPIEIRIQSKTTTVATINQRYWLVSGAHKLDALTRMLEVEEADALIIFVRTKTATVELAEKLEARGYACAALNGDMNQAQREKAVERLKNGSLDIVVATDVAARGLDVARISHVINYDIPNDTEAYVHRIGRTGRAGRKGEAILFVSPRERRMLRAIEIATGQSISRMHLPTQEDVADRRVAQFKERVGEVLEAQELAPFEALIESFVSERGIDPTEIAAALAYLVQRERPLFPPAPPPIEELRAPMAKPTSAAVDEAGTGKRRGKGEQPPMVRYRIEVGREHGVQPKNIVGAIANEAGVESRYIGQIKLYADYSTVDLPEGMPKDIFRHLQKVWVCGRPLQISQFEGDEGPAESRGSASQRKTAKPAAPRRAAPSTGKRREASGKRSKPGAGNSAKRPEKRRPKKQ
ncbi:ATP-dependent RNA helicase [Acidihalobacter aeolianus]|uniref:ATP-dependent RNA helicase DeaD n=1 Tax=Acidihalobacter aeolianus TaxID=2792603 RepID=A0A1D8K5Q2_9GAMM|nr:ATP-dependent RNA helicase [Acidihalobacter aeolianus]